ncbi:MAG: hypothetical protein J6Y28_08220 [Acholeplasmatales bacterium]|nr:hypothetical protein [Acholeplasmatales bacterium]
MINLIIFTCSIPVYADDERVKSIYEKAQRLKKRLRHLQQPELELSHDEDITETTVPRIIPQTTANTTLMPSDEIATPTVAPASPTSKPTQAVQIVTYANFETQKTAQREVVSTYEITYTLLVFYYNRPPARIITVTIRVYVRVPIRRNGRGLQEQEYELVPEDVETECVLKGDANTQGTRSYDCSGQTKTEAEELTNAKVNTNEDIKLDGEAAKSDEVALTGPAIVVGEDLITNTDTFDPNGQLLSLNDGKLTNIRAQTFNIEGNVANFNNHNPGDIFDFTLVHRDDGTKKKVECKVADPIEKVDDTNSKVTFNCGPYTEYLNANIDYVSGTYRGTPADTITLEISENSERNLLLNPPEGSNSTQNTQYQSYYRKNSSGLSGGAIAGIVIACAVALIIASVVAMMLRKSKPEENTSSSIVGLKTVDNF